MLSMSPHPLDRKFRPSRDAEAWIRWRQASALFDDICLEARNQGLELRTAPQRRAPDAWVFSDRFWLHEVLGHYWPCTGLLVYADGSAAYEVTPWDAMYLCVDKALQPSL